jgi:Putative MetA-pathway of phenol degradation
MGGQAMRFSASVLVAVWLVFALSPFAALAGPPFRTDDPEPVEYRNWEVYFASQYANDKDGVSATLPHLEVNYGLYPDLQVHVITPANYVKPSGLTSQYGYGDTEVGLKYRFFEKKDSEFSAGVFPILEIPTGDHSRGLGNGDPQLFLPLWFQKSWGAWTTYGGGGYWINPGDNNKNYWFVGWELQREITKHLMLGAEIFHQTAKEWGIDSDTGFNIGAIININENHHILMSAGRDIDGPNRFSSYLAYQYTFGPEKEKAEDKVEAH